MNNWGRPTHNREIQAATISTPSGSKLSPNLQWEEGEIWREYSSVGATFDFDQDVDQDVDHDV